MRCPLKVLAYDIRPQGIQGKEYELQIPGNPDGTPHKQLMCSDFLAKTSVDEDRRCVWWSCKDKTCGIAK